MRSIKSKEQVLKEGFSLFVTCPVPDEMLYAYMNDDDGEGVYQLQKWIINHMKEELSDWCTGIGIIEVVERLYQCALENDNLIG